MAGFGFEQRNDDHDGYADIPQNRTLIAEKLTCETALTPEVAHNLETMNDLFRHYQPGIDVSFEDAEGYVKRERLNFTSVDDFEPKNITKQSAFLSKATREKEQYLAISRQLRSDPELRNLLANKQTKTELLNAIQSMINELKQHQ